MRRYYAEFDVEIVSTQPSHDDARDGEGLYVLAKEEGNTHPRDDSLAIVYRIWLEVKKRKANVTLDDVGKNLVVADNRRVHKLVVVTNKTFAPQVKREFETFAARRNVSYSLVSGEELLALARDTAAGAAAVPAVASLEPTVHIELSFAPQPNPIDVKQVDDLVVQPDEPVFLIASVQRMDAGPVIDLALTVTAYDESIQVLPYPRPLVRSVGPRDRLRYVFVIHRAPRRGELTFRVVTSSPQATEVKTKVQWSGKCRVTTRLLSSWIPAKRWALLTSLQNRIATWIETGGRLSVALIAYAGVGKSVVLARLRSFWLAAGVREIYLQGAQRYRDADIAAILFEAAFPVERTRLRKEMIGDVERWLIDCGMNDALAVAEALCSDERVFHNLPPRELSRLCASLLRRIAGAGRAMLVAEDLHFCAPSAIELLKHVHLALSTFGDAHVAFVCTTRPFTAAADDEVATTWFEQLNDFLAVTAIHREDLPAFEEDEAADVLRRTIPTLEPHHARVIIEQVGTTPLALHEAVAWFATTGVVALDPVLDQLVADPDRLSEAVQSDDLADATGARIRVLKKRYPKGLPDLLDAAACVGRFFQFDAVLPAEWQSDGIDEDAVSACELFDVFHPVQEGLYAFDHDLIRKTVVDLMSSSRQQRIARSLVSREYFADKPYVRGTLLYQAASFAEASAVLQHAGRDAMHRHRYGDATRALLLALSCVDPATSSRTGPLVDLDVAVRKVDSRRRIPPLTLRGRKDVLDLLMTLLHCTGATAVFASDAAEAFLSEATMLARELGDDEKRAELLMMSGTRAFERDDVAASFRAHSDADRLLETIGARPDVRARNLLRLALIERSRNNVGEALGMFRRAHRLAGGGDPDLTVYLMMNIGAVFLDNDLRRTARYWRAGLRLAERANLSQWHVHNLTDVGYLELLRHQDAEAAACLNEAYDLAKGLELENLVLRSAMNLGCLHLVRGDLNRALELLNEAEEIGMRLRIGRRLWRVRANLATVHEARGNLPSAYRTDAWLMENLGVFEAGATAGLRQSLPLLNVVLRAEVSPDHQRLASQLDPAARREIDDVLASTLAARSDEPNSSLIGALRMIRGRPRFIVTE